MSKDIKLTDLTKSSGWAAKVGPDILAQVLCHLPKSEEDRLLVGLETSDDAAIYKINDELGLIQTLDFFTPVVDDPYVFGQIAAANSLSDVYAMGGEPKLAMNIVCFPNCLDPDVLVEILKGGYSKVEEAGAIVVGGHTVEDDEPKFGLSVSGFIHPDKILANSTAKPGDILVLTKPIGMGIMTSAIQGGLTSQKEYDDTVHAMATLNKYAKEAMDDVVVHSLTDITGFGLLGHALEMAEGSNVTVKIDHTRVPIIEGTVDYAQMGLVPEGAYDNMAYIGDRVSVSEDIPEHIMDVLFDPQTSGGLLASVRKDQVDKLLKNLESTPTEFAVVGEVVEKEETSLIVY